MRGLGHASSLWGIGHCMLDGYWVHDRAQHNTQGVFSYYSLLRGSFPITHYSGGLFILLITQVIFSYY